MKINDAVFISIKTALERFGKRIYIREAGTREAEEVELSEILVTVKDGSRVAATAAAIRRLLEKTHEKTDWAIVVGP